MSTDTRRFTIGGSDCGAAAGVHPYLSPIMLWAQKMGYAPQPEGEQLEWGVRSQPMIFDALRDRDWVVREHDGTVFTDETLEWVTGTPDGFAMVDGDEAVLEIKTTNLYAHRAGELQPQWDAQGQWYMYLTGLDQCMFAVLVGGQKLEIRTVERSDHAIRLLLDECAKFHACLVNDEQPKPDGSKSSRDALAALFPQAHEESVIRLTRAQMRTVDELRTLKAKAAALDVQIAERENLLRAVMGEAERAISPADDDVIRWSNVVSHRVDTKRLKADRPEIAGEYTSETTSRRFTVL